MSCFIAFLRSINVGGHTVKMETLRQLFTSFGFSEVETFIASGNVIFQTINQNPEELESKIAIGLHKALGFEVATFIRTDVELSQIATYQPFPRSKVVEAIAFNIAFLSEALDNQAINKLKELTTDIDSFATRARELYWLCRKKQSESTFSNALLEKTLGVKSTLRSLNTIKKIADRVSSLSPTNRQPIGWEGSFP